MGSFRDRLLDDMADADLAPGERLSAVWMYYVQYHRLQRLLRPVRLRAYEWDDDRVRAAIKFLDELIKADARVATRDPARVRSRKQIKSLRDRVHGYWTRETIAAAKGARRRKRRGTLTL